MKRQVRFYDTVPLHPYTLRLLWEAVLSDLAQGMRETKDKVTQPMLLINVVALTNFSNGFCWATKPTRNRGHRGVPRSDGIG